MITIIKHGKMKNRNESTCPFCGCIFAYNDFDIKNKGSSYYDPVYWIRCPDCGHELTGYTKDDLS